MCIRDRSQARQTASSDINGRNITIINYMDSNNFKEYSTDVMPQANGSNPCLLYTSSSNFDY